MKPGWQQQANAGNGSALSLEKGANMAINTTPHTESGQNQKFEESDLEPGTGTESVARGEDAGVYSEDEGAQTGTNRGPAHAPDGGQGHQKMSGLETVLEGSLETRAPQGAGQGISSHSQSEESAGQKKVVHDRPDAQSAVNQGK